MNGLHTVAVVLALFATTFGVLASAYAVWTLLKCRKDRYDLMADEAEKLRKRVTERLRREQQDER